MVTRAELRTNLFRCIRGWITAAIILCACVKGQALDAVAQQDSHELFNEGVATTQWPVDNSDSLAAGQPDEHYWPQWYIEAGSIFLWRDNDALSVREIDFDAGIGPNVLLGVRTGQNHGWEAEYFSALGMNGSKSYVSGPLWARMNYSSELHNVEINYLHTLGSFSVLGGFRFVNLSENLEDRSFRIGVDGFSGSLTSHTDNDLYGGQIGTRWRMLASNRFVAVTGKAGVFGNNSSLHRDLNRSDPLGAFDSAGPVVSDNSVSFVGDLNISAGYRISDAWTALVGYNLIWMSDGGHATFETLGHTGRLQHDVD